MLKRNPYCNVYKGLFSTRWSTQYLGETYLGELGEEVEEALTTSLPPFLPMLPLLPLRPLLLLMLLLSLAVPALSGVGDSVVRSALWLLRERHKFGFSTNVSFRGTVLIGYYDYHPVTKSPKIVFSLMYEIAKLQYSAIIQKVILKAWKECFYTTLDTS